MFEVLVNFWMLKSDPQCNVVNIGLGLTRAFGFPYFHVPHTYLGNRSIGLSFNQLVRSFVLSRSLQSWNVVCCSVASLFSSWRYVPTGRRWGVEWDEATQKQADGPSPEQEFKNLQLRAQRFELRTRRTMHFRDFHALALIFSRSEVQSLWRPRTSAFSWHFQSG